MKKKNDEYGEVVLTQYPSPVLADQNEKKKKSILNDEYKIVK